MSRAPINASALWDTTNHVMDTMTILDPSRLRIPFGKAKSLVSEAIEPYEETYIENSDNVLVDVSGLLKSASSLSKETRKLVAQFEVQAWVLSLGYSLFGLALCGTLLTMQFSGRVCGVMSPLPLACLLLQATTSALPAGIVFFSCAMLLPGICASESLPIAAVFVLVLAVGMLLHCKQRRGVLAYVCFAGAVLSLPLLSLEPKWGMSTAAFFLCILSVISCEKILVKVWV